MADIKKKFIDILFEDDDENSELSNNTEKVEKQIAANNSESPIKAKDILYRKSNGSAFINLEETTKNNVIEEIVSNYGEYEMSSQISPIFGVIKENKKKILNVDQDIIDTQTNKPSDSHLDIITSPIYGYGNKEDAQKNNYDVRSVTDENEEEELHQLFDDEQSLNDSFEKEINDPEIDIMDEDISLFKLFGDNK